ncbi:MAG TPA: hypothetical protein PKO09_18010 [Anaerolineae bacterium]|nr:hypothetical protein [Anaerolineae bacterium]
MAAGAGACPGERDWSRGGRAGGAGYVDIPIANHVVDYGRNTHLLWWQPRAVGETIQACAFQISYIPPGGLRYLPEVMNNH